MATIDFSVSAILTAVASRRGLVLTSDGLDDRCFGAVFAADSSVSAVLNQHMEIYNYLILDGETITLKRIAIGDDLAVDLEIEESDCIVRSEGPAIRYTNVDPMSIPREVELSYIDPNRAYAINTQVARHHGASKFTGRLSVTSSFVIFADQARELAFNLLYRRHAERLTLEFEHPDPRIEPGDVLQVSGLRGVYTVVVTESILSKERSSMVTAKVLLTSAPVIGIPGGVADGFSTSDPSSTEEYAEWLLTVL